MPFDHMHELLAGYIARGEIAGLVALVAHKGNVHVWQSAREAIAS